MSLRVYVHELPSPVGDRYHPRECFAKKFLVLEDDVEI